MVASTLCVIDPRLMASTIVLILPLPSFNLMFPCPRWWCVLQEAILASPMGVVRLMDMLMEREVIRNEALVLLVALTRRCVLCSGTTLPR